MTHQQSELLSSIQGLARRIHAETGRYVAYSEHQHTGGAVDAEVSTCNGYTDFVFFRGSENPVKGYQVTLERMREDLVEWIVAHRSITTSPGAAIGHDGDVLPAIQAIEMQEVV